MKAILINAILQTITEIEINDWSEISPAIGCDLFTCVRIDNVNTLYVDDEGLLRETNHFFSYNDTKLAGNGLILGNNAGGESVDTILNVEDVKGRVEFHGEETCVVPPIRIYSFDDLEF